MYILIFGIVWIISPFIAVLHAAACRMHIVQPEILEKHETGNEPVTLFPPVNVNVRVLLRRLPNDRYFKVTRANRKETHVYGRFAPPAA